MGAMTRMPVIFVGHGSPMNAIEDNANSRGWADLAKRFAKPAAILCVSAHWVTDGVRVLAAPKPRTIHDFGGFPAELHAVQYPAPGAPTLAKRVATLLASFGAETDLAWGLDHGAWSVLAWMYPDADVPVLQLSLDARRSPQQHYDIARALAPLRSENVLILASGNIVHNLRAFFGRGLAPGPWSERFEGFVVDAATRSADAEIIAYDTHPDSALAAPDWEHFVPILYALGARSPGERLDVLTRDIVPGVAMTSLAFGLR